MGLNMTVGLLDGFGIAMFLPLLQMVDGDNSVRAEDLGGLEFLISWIDGFGLKLDLSTVLIFMLFFFILKGIARFCESYYRTAIQHFFVRNLRIETLHSLRDYSYRYFVSSDSGKIQNTLSGEVNKVTSASSTYFMAMQGVIMALVYSILAFMANAQFAIMVLFGGILSNQLFKVLNRKTMEASRKITWEGHEYQGLLIQKVGFFKYLKATGLIDLYTEKMVSLVERIESSGKKIGVYGTILQAVKEPVIMAVIISVIFIHVYFLGGQLGLIILSLLFFYRALTFLMSLQTFYNSFLMNSGSLENMQDFLHDLESKKENIQKGIKVRIEDQIKLNDISFAYNGNPTLSEINLTINKNESIAFVGESGSGKTTLVNLISGLIPKQSGQFLIDSTPFEDIDLKYYQSKIGYITQEPVVFSDTVYNNVTFWAEKNEENLKRFWYALERAHIAEFIKQLPDKEDSALGTNGILVSGGQKQRISIARELFKDIDILIMDEATSALDSESEKIIQENIDSLQGKITLIIVAHRLATIKNVDKVVILSKGRIIGSNSFGKLVESSSDFKRMVELQMF
jgi:subfamily B ATP-binding cassette protein MsbA